MESSSFRRILALQLSSTSSKRLAVVLLLGLSTLVLVACSLRPLAIVDGVGTADALALAVAKDTATQQALVSNYLHLIHDHRYAEAWALLSPERQKREPLDRFVDDWRTRGEVSFAYPTALVTWPAAYDDVRAMVVLMHENSGGRETLDVKLVPVQGQWRIDDERVWGPSARSAPLAPPTVEGLIRDAVLFRWGSLWVPTMRILESEPFRDGRIVIYRALVPSNHDQDVIYREVVLEYARSYDGGWGFFGGGYIGTVIGIDPRDAVQCAWTWISLADGVAGFYCLVQDPRVATVELVRTDGGVMRQDVNGRQAIVFPYSWDASHQRWPDQQPRAIRIFDSRGQSLDLPTSRSL